MTVAGLKPLINCFTVAGHCNRSIVVALGGRAGDFPNAPGNTVIPGHDDGLIAILVARLGCSATRIVRHVNGPVGRDFDMTMQATTVGSCKHDCRRAESKSPAIAGPPPGGRHA